MDHSEIIYLFDTFIDTQHPKMRETAMITNAKLICLAPTALIQLLEEALLDAYRLYMPSPGARGAMSRKDAIRYRDVDIFPGYEMALVLYHPGCTSSGDPVLIKRQELGVGKYPVELLGKMGPDK